MISGMFGAARKKTNPLDMLQMGQQPMSTMPMGGLVERQPAPPPPVPTGFNAPGGWAEKLGAIGGILQSAGGMQNNGLENYRQTLAARQQQALAQQQYQQRRQDDNSDWVARQQWEIEHPKPVSNDTANDVALYDQLLGPGKGKQFLENQLDPIVNIPLPGGRVFVGPRSRIALLTGGETAPAPEASAGLPQGFTVRPKGGAGPQTPRPFR